MKPLFNKPQPQSEKYKLKLDCYFVTGTDTDVGKTVCTKALLQAANAQQKKTLAYKPISAGCEKISDELRNEDALILQAESSIDVDYQMVNPIAFLPPIAPHIAAKKVGASIDFNKIDSGLNTLLNQQADLCLVEGAGGWYLPINDTQLLSQWVESRKLPVIVVVGLKLGCLNHALLTVKSIQQSGLTVVGWIANHIQAEMPYAQENIETLQGMIEAPLLAEIPYLKDVQETNLSKYINIEFV